MAAPTTPAPFGATIIPTTTSTPTHNDPLPQPSSQHLDSPLLTPAVSNDDLASSYHHNTTTTEKPIPIHSPFYTHPPASFERASTPHCRSASKSNLSPHIHEKDLESGHPTPLADDDTNPFTSKLSLGPNNPECKMWPSRQTLVQTKTREKREKRALGGCGRCVVPVRDLWSRLDKRQRLWVKLALAVVLAGVAIAVGLGITRAVHGGVYAGKGQHDQVGQ